MRRLMACLLALLIGAGVPARPLEAQNATIDEVKAAFLFNFTKFVQWPADTFPNDASPFVIGILGSDTISDILREVIRGKTVNGHEIRLKRVSADDDLTQLQLLFISKSVKSQMPDIVTRVTGKAVLTVADAVDFSSGGVIQFVVIDDQVRFDINLDPAQHAHLGVSSKLLTLARGVYLPRISGVR